MENKESSSGDGSGATGDGKGRPAKNQDDHSGRSSPISTPPSSHIETSAEKLLGEEKRKQTLETNAMKARERRKRQKMQRDKEQDFIMRVSQETAELKRENEQLRQKILSYERILHGHPLVSATQTMYGNILDTRQHIALLPPMAPSMTTTNSSTPSLNLTARVALAQPREQHVSAQQSVRDTQGEQHGRTSNRREQQGMPKNKKS